MTAKKDIFNIVPSYSKIVLSLDKEVNDYYTRQKQEYIRKYNLTELKQGKTKTSLEAWN